MAYDNPRIRALQRTNPAAVELAETVSFAVLIEPQLLRAARRELVPDADAGAEADVWLSSIVEARSPDGIVLDRNAAQLLRRELRECRPDRFERAWRLLRSQHAHIALAIRLEEEINYSLTELDGEAKERIGKLLAKATATLISDPKRKGLANWAARLLPKLPPEVRELDPARVLAVAAYVRLANFIPEWSDDISEELTKSLASILPTDFPERQIRVRFVATGVDLSTLVVSDEPSVPVPATDPALIEVSWDADGRREVARVELSPGERRLVETGATEIRVRTIAGLRFLLKQQRVGEETMPDKKKTCFVVMGFGKKTDYLTGRVLDLDKTYRYIIKPAAEEAGFECERVDEIVHSGLIDVPAYDRLLTADVVIADLSTSNANAFYELGIRHALRPYTTITIAEDKMVYPFDVSQIRLQTYHHLGDGIDFGEVERMKHVLSEALKMSAVRPGTDSPVYERLPNLRPPVLVGSAIPPASDAGANSQPTTPASSEQLRQADEALARSDFVSAKSLLQVLRSMAPSDSSVLRKLATATYKSGLPTPERALIEARETLSTLEPGTTTDTETLSLWAAIHKRLWDIKQDRASLDTAIWAYQKAFLIKDDYYNGINHAYLLDVRAVGSSLAEGVADSILAQRTRRHVIELCSQALTAATVPDERYWILATMAEAYLGLGDQDRSSQIMSRIREVSSAPGMIESTEQQIKKLAELLSQSPLQNLPRGSAQA